MPDPSNPTARVMDVLSFLSAHPTESFTLAEIARALGLSNGSAHRILTTMAAADFLQRNAKHRTYSLGIALVAIGQAAIEKHRGIEIARRELARLAVDLGVQCSASAVVEDEVLVLVKEGTPQSHLGPTRVGERRPLVPPTGICHAAWGGDAVVEAYLALAGNALSEAMRAHLLTALPVIRRRGFAVGALGPTSDRAQATMVIGGDRKRDAAYWPPVLDLVAQLTADQIQLLDLDAAPESGFSYVSAPVFSPTGAVAMQLVINGLPRDVSLDAIRRYAERLTAAAAIVTTETHGRPPALF